MPTDGNPGGVGQTAVFPTANVFMAPGLSSPITKEFTVSGGGNVGRGYADATYIWRSTDNVIAPGQTIPLTADTTAQYVDLLVASTCGGTKYDASIQATINFVDGSYSQVQLPAVPDWITWRIMRIM